MGMSIASYPNYVLIDNTVRTSLRTRTLKFSSFRGTPSFRSRLKKWSRGKTDPQDQTHWSTDYVLLLQLICTDQIFLKNFTECSNVIDFLSVTNFKIGTYITPEKYLTPS